MFDTPVLFIVFNRPNVTRKSFEQIRAVRPKKIFIAADGPRDGNEADHINCREVKSYIRNSIDWPCDTYFLFRETNLGCGRAVSEAINWFFEHVEEGIILEDDCIPSTSFFTFCESLLIKHRNDDTIMHITGTNLDDRVKFGSASYYATTYPHIWGWATWRKAWLLYDYPLCSTSYPDVIKRLFKDPFEKAFWLSILAKLNTNKIDTWDYQWMFSIWACGGICLNTNYNFIKNIGFGDNATHTKGTSTYLNDDTKDILLIDHPNSLQIIREAEPHFLKLVHGIERKGYTGYVLQKIKNAFHKLKMLFN